MPIGADDEAEDVSKPWMIRDVPARTRRKVKTFASSRDMSIAQALTKLVDDGLEMNGFDASGGRDYTATDLDRMLMVISKLNEKLMLEQAKALEAQGKGDLKPSKFKKDEE